ncbi:MAG: Ig-like domain-containing protein, partial [Planctomycetota bacterium]
MRSRRPRIALVWLAAGLSATLLGLWTWSARAGGNIQFRNPANLAEVFDRTWDDRMLPVTWVLSEDGLPGTGIDNATIIAELTAAYDTWESLTTSTLDFEFGGEVPIRTTGLDGPLGPGIDGVNLVTFTDPALIFPPGVLAVSIAFAFPTDTVIDSTNSDLDGDAVPDIPEGTYLAGTIFDNDIAFNSSEPWETSGANGTFDIRAVGLHEIGHGFGLAHSSIAGAVMWPFLDNDIAAARTPKTDDIAYASFYYPEEPAYSSTFGAIRGQIINGFSSATVLGAHVYAADTTTGAKLVGAYSGDDGSYVLPGLATGDFLVGIEPLDGDPAALDPARVNEVILFTFDTNFPEELYDANESNVEADPTAGLAVSVTAGADTTGIDLVTNTLQVPGVNLILEPGYNLFSYPVEVPSGIGAFDLLQALGDDAEVNSIQRFEPATNSFERAVYVDGNPAGVDFPIQRGEGYVVYMATQKVVSFSGNTDCPDLDLKRSTNLIGVACPPAGYSAYELLQALGARFEVQSIERYDTETGTFQLAQYDASEQPIGDDFPVSNGEGYVVTMLADKAGLRVPPIGTSFPPVITGLTPGRGVPGTTVVLLGEGFDSDPAQNTVTFNGVGAGVVFATATTITATVPPGASTGPVQVTVGSQQSNTIDFTVESAVIAETPGAETPLVSGQTAQGTLTADGEQDRYTFTALAGSLVTISATSIVPGVPDLVLLLEDPFGVLVAANDNGGGGTDPRINNFELQNTGTYTAVVSNVPGSGLGDYQISISIATRTSEPQISIIGGNFQTGVIGSTLPAPLSVFVTGATGAPVAGVPVTFVATDPSFGSLGSWNYGTTIISTDSSGIAEVETTLPAADGSYQITVTVPGAPAAAAFLIAATTAAVSQVDMNGDLQSGTVGQQLTNPLEIILRDTVGSPVGGGLVAFQVVSGGGSVSVNNPQVPYTFATTTDALTGSATATYTLGTDISDAQIVAAFVPGLLQPLLFEAIPQADVPNSIVSNRTNFNRMTLGTAVLNAMRVQVFDQYDNPVKDATVNYTAAGGLLVEPGLGPGGVLFPDFKTDHTGLHVAMLIALEGSVDPTLNEFEERVLSVLNVDASVAGGSNPTENYVVDVDMGPSMVTSSVQNDGECIGQPLPNPVAKKVLRWQRDDTFEDANGDGDDDDNGDFRDEDYQDLTEKGVRGVTIDLEVRREDGKDEASVGMTPTTIASTQIITDANGIGTVNVSRMGDVGGINFVVGRIEQIHVEWRFADGSLLDQRDFTNERKFGESTNLVAVPIVVTLDVTDSGSGIDFSTVKGSINGTSFFDGMSPPAVPPGFPEPMLITIGGQFIQSLDPAFVNDSAFSSILIDYAPAAPNLKMGTNLAELGPLKDKAQNEQTSGTVGSFSYPCDDEATNGAPILVPIGNRTVAESATLNVGVVASDPDGDNITLTAAGLPAFCSITDNGNGTGTIDCSPGAGTTGGYPITVMATDDGTPNLDDSEVFTLTVGDYNQPPVLDEVADQTIDEGQNANFALSSSDPDGDNLTLSFGGLPGFCTPTDNGDGSGDIDCNPNPGDDGTYAITATVTDDGTPNLNHGRNFNLTVKNLNDPPTLAALADRVVDENQPFSVALSATDLDGDTLSFFATGMPGFCTLTDNGDGSGSIDCTPSTNDVGFYTVNVTVRDNGTPTNLTDTKSFDITVNELNDPPLLGAIGDRTQFEGTQLTVNLSATEPENDNLVFSESGLPTF